jgi:hypothetical protein
MLSPLSTQVSPFAPSENQIETEVQAGRLVEVKDDEQG